MKKVICVVGTQGGIGAALCERLQTHYDIIRMDVDGPIPIDLADPASIAAVPSERWPALAMHHELIVLLLTDPDHAVPVMVARTVPFYSTWLSQRVVKPAAETN